ncbi:MAG: hypothetical protein JNK92_14205 [Dechloromonas sp.]|nr:hypothetical protein [Dechloromonas sp.]
MRLGKQIGVSRITATWLLHKMRIAIGHRESTYQLHDLTETDNSLAGSRSNGERGAEGTFPPLVEMEDRDARAGFIAMQQVSAVTRETAAKSIRSHLPPGKRSPRERWPYAHGSDFDAAHL